MIIADAEPDADGLVRVLQAQPYDRLSAAGRLDPRCACAASCANGRERKGRGRGADHQRWPNAFFAEQGLFSLVAAHAQARQSSRR